MTSDAPSSSRTRRRYMPGSARSKTIELGTLSEIEEDLYQNRKDLTEPGTTKDDSFTGTLRRPSRGSVKAIARSLSEKYKAAAASRHSESKDVNDVVVVEPAPKARQITEELGITRTESQRRQTRPPLPERQPPEIGFVGDWNRPSASEFHARPPSTISRHGSAALSRSSSMAGRMLIYDPRTMSLVDPALPHNSKLPDYPVPVWIPPPSPMYIPLGAPLFKKKHWKSLAQMDHALMSFDFLIMVFYGLIGVPLYIATIIIILKSKTLTSSFYTIYVASAVANLIMYFNKFPLVRLPYFTCGECPLSEVFNNQKYWWLNPSLFTHWHISYTQYQLPTLVSFDRFVVIVLGGRPARIWKKAYKLFIVLVYVTPGIFSWNVFKSDNNFGYLNETDNFRYTMSDTQSWVILYESITVLMVVTSLISLVCNGWIFLQFFCGKIQIPGAQRVTEIKLFVNCVMDMGTQISSAIIVYYQRMFLLDDRYWYDLYRLFTLYVVDIMSLLPPFILVLTCSEIRETVLKSFRSLKILTADNSRILPVSQSH